ncbi:MAG: winged helix DNA-binding protein [Bacteroidales bacterium]
MQSICVMRDLYQAIATYENQFMEIHGLSLNEAMALCCLSEGVLSASEIAEKSNMKSSHTSKVLKSIEEKKLITRTLGKNDKRQMYFKLTEAGKERLIKMSCESVQIPLILKPIFKMKCPQIDD